MRRIIFFMIVAACLVGICSYAWSRAARFDQAKQIILEHAATISRGDSLEVVKETLLSDSPDLTMKDWGAIENIELNVQEVRFSTPSQFGAKDWVLVMYFQHGKVAAWGMRTGDSDFEMPKGAPEDQWTSSVADVWQTRMILE